MQKLVIDSSVIIKWLNHVDEQLVDKAEEILQDVQSGKVKLLAPELAKYEVCNSLLIKKKLSPAQMKEALEAFYMLPIQFFDDSLQLAEFAYFTGDNIHITYYDAAFLALAQLENASLVTDNVKHHGKTKEIHVIPLKEYSFDKLKLLNI